MPDAALSSPKNHTKQFIFFVGLYSIILFAGQLLLQRNEFVKLIVWQSLLHIGFIGFYYYKHLVTIKQIIWAAILLRIGTAFFMPTLSDDVYRFIWDGQLIVHGNNPMLTTPDHFLTTIQPESNYYTKLHGLINHPQFYTCYPPLMQAVFAFAAFFAGKSVFTAIILIKLIVAISDCLAILYLVKILKKLEFSPSLVILYALNPLVIIEGAGNAHFEVMQVALMCVSFYYLLLYKNTIAAVFWGFAIITKLLPLLLLPIIVRTLGVKKGIAFSAISMLIASISFLPFVSVASINAFSKSLNLYFQNFEFNASVYYVAREIGWWLKGYNYISFIGPFLMVVFLFIYALIFFVKRKMLLSQFALYALIILSLYYFFATTVHPWYIINLLPFALIANKKYAFVWMGIAFLSYNAYGNINFKENFYLVAIEYLVVMVAMVYSFKKEKIMVNK